MVDVSVVVLTVIRAIVSCIHISGFYLLFRAKKSSLCRSQRLYLMNFSFTEVMLCCVGVAKRICQMTGEKKAQNYILIIQWTGLSLAYYFAMILLTLDRFLKFMLDIKYVTVWTKRKTKITIACSWVLCLVTCVVCLWIIPKNEQTISRLATLYFFSTFDITFVIIAGLFYASLFRTLNQLKTRRQSLSLSAYRSSVSIHKNSIGTKLQKLRAKRSLNVLFVPTWIIITFLIFIMLPDQLYFYCFIMKKDLGHVGDIVISFTYSVGFISDAFIYVFLSPPVRKTLMRILRRECKCFQNRLIIKDETSFVSRPFSEEMINLAKPRETNLEASN